MLVANYEFTKYLFQMRETTKLILYIILYFYKVKRQTSLMLQLYDNIRNYIPMIATEVIRQFYAINLDL